MGPQSDVLFHKFSDYSGHLDFDQCSDDFIPFFVPEVVIRDLKKVRDGSSNVWRIVFAYRALFGLIACVGNKVGETGIRDAHFS